jgi:hypothetical protein
MKITRSRTFLQVRVGRNAIAEVVFNVRLADLEWINAKQQQQQQQQQKDSDSNDDDDDDDDGPSTTERKTTVLQEFFHLLQTSILPRIMGSEIEECNYYHGDGSREEEMKPPQLGPGGIPISVVAEKNKRNTTTTTTTTSSSSGTNNKRGGGIKNKKGSASSAAVATTGAAAAGAKRKRGAGKNKLEPPPVQTDDEDRATRFERDVFYAFGESIQVAYRWEDIREEKNSNVSLVFCKDTTTSKHVNDDSSTTKATSSTTLNNNSGSSSRNNNNNNMRQLQTLSKRILAWCYPYDPANNNPSEPDPPGGGFPLPERIPIASLFRDRGGGRGVA